MSHVFFADDLLLVGKATIEQARVMEDILTCFCNQSSQKVSLPKSRIWISPNSKPQLAATITSTVGMMLTSNLGKYLGVPIHYDRIQRKTFGYMVENVRRKFAGWIVAKLSQGQKCY